MKNGKSEMQIKNDKFRKLIYTYQQFAWKFRVSCLKERF